MPQKTGIKKNNVGEQVQDLIDLIAPSPITITVEPDGTWTISY